MRVGDFIVQKACDQSELMIVLFKKLVTNKSDDFIV